MADDGLIKKIWELVYRGKRLYNNGGMHGIVHRIREQITGQVRPPSTGWYTHDEQIQAGLKNLREGLKEAGTRGLSDTINSKYTNVNKVSTMDNPKPTDKGVPKICQ
ncbi:hypothetical protein [Anaerocolumna jejuensis]|uniref:hypothetical protein n=1 Tax=Anaerocolumna jejuensis TaxID=259063 RepID=UPI003F7BCAB0